MCVCVRQEFCLVHYAGPVTYDVKGFLDKNSDLLYRDLKQVGSRLASKSVGRSVSRSIDRLRSVGRSVSQSRSAQVKSSQPAKSPYFHDKIFSIFTVK